MGAIAIAIAIAIAMVALVAHLWNTYRLTHPSRNHAMTDLTTKMKTVCFGRYLIDVPADAEVALGNASSDSNAIKRIASFGSEGNYAHRLQQHEENLRNARHDTEGSLLRFVNKSADGQQTVFVSRSEADDTFTYVVESLVHAPPVAWHVSRRTGATYLKVVTQRIAEIAQALTYREPTAIPTTPGACLADGLLNRTPLEVESFEGGARIEALSWSLSFSSETSGPRDNVRHSDLFVRVDRAIDMAGPGSGIQKLRRAKVDADGRNGQEYIGLYPGEEAIILDAKLELYGNAKPQQPTIKLLMETGWPINKHPEDPRRFLDQEEALAVWDAVVKSIRPRPGAF